MVFTFCKPLLPKKLVYLRKVPVSTFPPPTPPEECFQLPFGSPASCCRKGTMSDHVKGMFLGPSRNYQALLLFFAIANSLLMPSYYISTEMLCFSFVIFCYYVVSLCCYEIVPMMLTFVISHFEHDSFCGPFLKGFCLANKC